MRSILHISLASFATYITLTSTSVAKPPDCKHDINRLSCAEYVSNYDGNSFVFNILDVHPLLGDKLKFDLSNVNTGSVRSKDDCEKSKAKQAQTLVKDLLKNAKRIDLVNIEKSKSGKLSGDVLVDERSLKEILLQDNFAIPAKEKDYNWCNTK